MSDEFKDAMDRWVDLKKQLKVVRADVKVLNQEEKKLREFIQGYMRTQHIDTCKVATHDVKVSHAVRTAKAPFTKELVRRGLMEYFRGDETLVDRVFEIIANCADEREVDRITVKGL